MFKTFALSSLIIISQTAVANNLNLTANTQIKFVGFSFSPKASIDRQTILQNLKLISSFDWQILTIDRQKLTKTDMLLAKLDYLAFPANKTFISTSKAWSFFHQIATLLPLKNFDYLEPSFASIQGINPNQTNRLASLGTNIKDVDNPETVGLYEWHLAQTNVRQAWQHSLTCKRPSRGLGIKIALPDSGFVAHPEFNKNEKIRPMIDYIEGDMNPEIDPTKQDPAIYGGLHGLSTGVLIASQTEPDNAAPHITGIAPEAELLIYRVTAPGDLLPAPVLLNSDMNKLASSIWDAIAQKCQIISVSLGGLRHSGVQKAIATAVEKGILVICAAGNKVMTIVYPALDQNAIAVAANTFTKKPWAYSSCGSKICFCAPGEGVYSAQISADLKPEIVRMSGTSYATAITSGIAALWLGHHGHANLCQKYGAHNLNNVFKFMVQQSIPPTPENLALKARQTFGNGIIDALALLKAPLPTYAELEKLGKVQNLSSWRQEQAAMATTLQNDAVLTLAGTYLTGQDAINVVKGFLKACSVAWQINLSKMTNYAKEILFNFQLDQLLPFALFQQYKKYLALNELADSDSIKVAISNDQVLAASLQQINQTLQNKAVSPELQSSLNG